MDKQKQLDLISDFLTCSLFFLLFVSIILVVVLMSTTTKKDTTQANTKNTQQIIESKQQELISEPKKPSLEANEFIVTVKITTIEPEDDTYISEKLNGAISLISSVSSIKKVEVISIEK